MSPGDFIEVKSVSQDEQHFWGHGWNKELSRSFRFFVKRIWHDVESAYYVHMNEKGRFVKTAFDVSLSFGCAVGCLFCPRSDLYPVIPLSQDEIFEQFAAMYADYCKMFPSRQKTGIDVFFAGSGESTLMPEAVISVAKRIIEICPRARIKLSGLGVNPKAFAIWAKSDIPIGSIQISILHSDEKMLKYIFCGCKGYSLKDVLSGLRLFSRKKPEVKVKFNYIGIKNFNDKESVLKKVVSEIKKGFGSRFELKISSLSPRNANCVLVPVAREDLVKLSESAKTLDVKDVYMFGPKNGQEIHS